MKADADYWKGFWAGRAIAVRLTELAQPIEVSGTVLPDPETEEDEA